MATALTSEYTRFTDKCNKVLAGGIVKTFEPNSLTPKTTYQDPECTIPNFPEITLDETGRAKIYIDGDYRIQVYSRDGILIEDNLLVEQSLVQRDFTSLSQALELEQQEKLNQFQAQADQSIQDLLKHGGRAYPTLALANADIANIALDTKVTVLSATDGGDWYKATAGATSLTKSPYDPVTQAKADATTKANAAEANAESYADIKTIEVKDFFNDDTVVALSSFSAGSDLSGSSVVTDTVFKSATVQYIPNSSVVLTRPSVSGFYYGHQFSDAPDKFTAPVWGYGETTTVSHPTAKYVRFYIRKTNAALTITNAEVLASNISFKILTFKAKSNKTAVSRALNNFSDTMLTPADFALGNDNAVGEIVATNWAKTKPFYLKDGGVLTLTNITNGDPSSVAASVAVSDNPETGFGTKVNFTSNQFTITPDKPFFKVYVTAGSFDFEKFKAMPNFRVASSVGFKLRLDLESDIQRLKASAQLLNFDVKKFTVTEKDFVRGATNSGTIRISDSYLQTRAFKVKAADVITVTVPATTPKFVWNVGYGVNEIPTQEQKNNSWYTETSFSVTVPSGMNYMVFLVSKEGQGTISDAELSEFKFSATLNKTAAQELYDYTQQANDKTKTFGLSTSDFYFGELDNVQVKTGIYARSKLTYKLPPNKTIKLTASPDLDVTAILADSYDSSRKINISGDQFTNITKVVNTTNEMQYVRVYVKSKNNVTITREQFFAYTSKVLVSFVDAVARQSDLSDLAYQMNKKNGGLTKFTESVGTNYRTPSKAFGGLVSFIDDDGRTELFTQLHPFVVANNIPYGYAVSPGLVGTAGYSTAEQLLDISRNSIVEFQSHTWSHASLSGSTPEVIQYQIQAAKEWFIQNGFYVQSFVYPFGNDSGVTHSILTQYYDAAFDFGQNFVETFDTINNFAIRRWILNFDSDITALKAAIDQAHATNGWIVITTHAGLAAYWDETMTAKILEVYNYAVAVGCKVVKPSEGFQTFGNIVENDSGFKIAANGKIIGAS